MQMNLQTMLPKRQQIELPEGMLPKGQQIELLEGQYAVLGRFRVSTFDEAKIFFLKLVEMLKQPIEKLDIPDMPYVDYIISTLIHAPDEIILPEVKNKIKSEATNASICGDFYYLATKKEKILNDYLKESQDLSDKKNQLESCIAKKVVIQTSMENLESSKGSAIENVQRLMELDILTSVEKLESIKQELGMEERKQDTLNVVLRHLVHQEKEIQDKELHLMEEIEQLNNKISGYNIYSCNNCALDVHKYMIGMMTDIWSNVRQAICELESHFATEG